MRRTGLLAQYAGCVAGCVVGLAGVANAQVVINEVFANPPGSGSAGDDRWEYIEIYGPPGMSLNGYAIATAFGGTDGDSDAVPTPIAPNGIPGPNPGIDVGDELAEIDEAWSLDGQSIGSNGLFVLYNNNGNSSLAVGQFAPATNRATFVQCYINSTDAAGAGRIKNDGSATFILLRKRPFHTLNASGLSLYDGSLNSALPNGSGYPSSIRYAWRKDVNPDVDFDGQIDFNGIGNFVLGGAARPAETPVNSEEINSPPAPVGPAKSLEPYQMVDDLAWSNEGGKEYVRSRQQEISQTPGYNPDAVTRVQYFGRNPQRGNIFEGGVMSQSRIADEEFVYGDVPSVAGGVLAYDAINRAGPTDPAGPTYNGAGILDPLGTFKLNDINLTGYRMTPGNFNDVNSSGTGGINIAQFRFVPGDFDFDGDRDCDDRALIAARVGAGLDDTEVKVDENGTPSLLDDFTYTHFKFEGRDFNALLAMVRMSLIDGTNGQWNSGVTVTAADLAAFDALLGTACTPACVADVDDGSGTGTRDGGVGIEDLLYYLALFEAGTSAADVDDGSGTGTTDGGVGIEDLLYFLTRFEAGC